MNNNKPYTGFNRILQSEAVQTILNHNDDGTFSEFLGDWKWIFSFSLHYKLIIVFYTLVGIIGSTHRPSVLKLCDRVYRVEDGQIRQTQDVRDIPPEEPPQWPPQVPLTLPPEFNAPAFQGSGEAGLWEL